MCEELRLHSTVGSWQNPNLSSEPATPTPRHDEKRLPGSPGEGASCCVRVPLRAAAYALPMLRTPMVVPCMQVDISATVPTTVTRSPGLKPPASPASV